MKNKSILLIAILSIITLFQNCSNDELILNEDYVTVSDLMKYCSKTPCDKPVEWEGQEVKVKGHIDDNYMLLKLKDIRNGYDIQISIDSSCNILCIDSIVKKILSNNKKNMCYIKGTLQSFENNTTFNCTVGCEILLHSADDIYFENKY